LRGATVGGFLGKTTEGKTRRNGLALRIGIGDNLLIGLLPCWGDSK